MLGLKGGEEPSSAYKLSNSELTEMSGNLFERSVLLSFAAVDGAAVQAPVPAGSGKPAVLPVPPVVDTPSQSSLLMEALQIVAQGRTVCFVGPAGEGKSVLAHRFASALAYPPEKVYTLHMYKDMTSRDLFQRRSTDSSGNTRWEPSPLLTAALTGGLCVLDGLQRLRPDTLAALQTLCSDMDLDLPDGTRLCRHDRFTASCSVSAAPEAVLQGQLSLGPLCGAACNAQEGEVETQLERHLRPVHPNFRFVALALPPGQKPAEQWLTAELLPLFGWLVLPRLASDERAALLASQCPSPELPVILRLASRLRSSVPSGSEASASHAGWSLSLRQLLRLGRRTAVHPSSIASDVRRVSLASFMPVASRSSFEEILQTELGAACSDTSQVQQADIVAKVESGILDIGGAQLRIGTDADPRRIPHTKFFDIPRHLLRLREIVRDLSLGEKHILLIGNQGTGKNKLVDHLLELLRWEREYIQLHRDTTVSSLTVQASLVDGKVVWEDSPLVQAVRFGRALVIDEADKAPLEVVCILKGLVEDGEMTLADGRRILRTSSLAGDGDKVIAIHPRFKMFLLANRPGFPFQGNDLFRETGDVYAPHVVENPDLASEVQLLRSYAPNVDVSVLRRLSSAFTELRRQVDEGLLAYPYSTRELVNVSRHLEVFPGQSVGEALRDILDFDRHDEHALSTLREVLLHWGIPLDVPTNTSPGLPEQGEAAAIDVAQERRLPAPQAVERWLLHRVELIPKISPMEVEVRNCSYMLDFRKGQKLEAQQGSRAARFTEELKRWRLPLSESKYEMEAAVACQILSKLVISLHLFNHLPACQPSDLNTMNCFNPVAFRVHKSKEFN